MRQGVEAQPTHCFLQSLYALVCVSRQAMRATRTARSTHWKKSLHMARSPPLRFKHRILLSAASWHGSKYSLYALLLPPSMRLGLHTRPRCSAYLSNLVAVEPAQSGLSLSPSLSLAIVTFRRSFVGSMVDEEL